MKQMKKILLALSVALISVSCSEWLYVTPFDSLEKDHIYKNERGANSALNGLYLMLAGDNLYGKELSVGMIEILGQNFAVSASTGTYEHRYHQLSQYDYSKDNSKAILKNVFTAAYKAIANCNEFLESVQASKSVFSQASYDLYMGEAIAVRTMLHFDMLRLFGPNPANFGKPSVPYYNISTDIPQPILPADQLLDQLIADIDEAIGYLKNDPILTEGLNSSVENATHTDFFKSFRNMHMNYYGAYAIKARMCLYKGTPEGKAEAYDIATCLLEGIDPGSYSESTNFKEVFHFQAKNLVEARFKVFYPEVLFGIHNSRLAEIHKNMFSADLTSQYLMTAGPKFWDRLYVSGPAGNDGNGAGLRKEMWVQDNTRNAYLFTRIAPGFTDDYHPYHHQFQGIMRIGELYLIASETAPDLATKRFWLEQMRNGKGYDPGNANGLNDAQLDEVIQCELRKDTYGEGQYFFFAKRKTLSAFYNQANANMSMSAGKYVLPLPEVETDFRTE